MCDLDYGENFIMMNLVYVFKPGCHYQNLCLSLFVNVMTMFILQYVINRGSIATSAMTLSCPRRKNSASSTSLASVLGLKIVLTCMISFIVIFQVTIINDWCQLVID